MYVSVKGGEKAIDNAHKLMAEERRGDPELPELTVAQIREQMGLAVDRVMAEGALYDRDLAALALKQAQGDLFEAVFLVRAFRTTLPRFAVSEPVDTSKMQIRRRVSAAYKDLPGGQVLGPTFDYMHRLIDFSLEEDGAPEPAASGDTPADARMPRVTDILKHQGLIEEEAPDDPDAPVRDLTREPLTFPAGRELRLQNLARGDEGFVMALAYSTQRGYGRNHPFAGEIRMGEAGVSIVPEELGFEIEIAEITVTECQMINQFKGSKAKPPQFTRGYGLTLGYNERKAMAMALVDRALRSEELGEEKQGPAQDEEFVLSHTDILEAGGFVQHLKLPHYVDFQSELELIRRLRRAAEAANQNAGEDEAPSDAAE